MEQMIDQLNDTMLSVGQPLLTEMARQDAAASPPCKEPSKLSKTLRKTLSRSFLRQPESPSVDDFPLPPVPSHDENKLWQVEAASNSPGSTWSWNSSMRSGSIASLGSTVASSVSATSKASPMSLSMPRLLKSTRSTANLKNSHRHERRPSTAPTPPSSRKASVASTVTSSSWDRKASVTSTSNDRKASVASSWDADPIQSRKTRAELYSQRLHRILSSRRSRTRSTTPQAEIEMTPMKEVAYFRAPSITSLSVVTAICGCYLITTDPGKSQNVARQPF